MSTRGRWTLPVELRRSDSIKPGEEFEVVRLAPGDYLFKRLARRPDEANADPPPTEREPGDESSL